MDPTSERAILYNSRYLKNLCLKPKLSPIAMFSEKNLIQEIFEYFYNLRNLSFLAKHFLQYIFNYGNEQISQKITNNISEIFPITNFMIILQLLGLSVLDR
jgi:hypothetical protein